MIQRYGLFGAYDDWQMEPDSDGEYVLFSNHVAAVARMKSVLGSIAAGPEIGEDMAGWIKAAMRKAYEELGNG